jgi:hypothetical protein
MNSLRNVKLKQYLILTNNILYINNLNTVKDDKMDGACSTNGENRNVYRLLVGRPEEKGPLGGPRRRWVDNIRMDLDWI